MAFQSLMIQSAVEIAGNLKTLAGGTGISSASWSLYQRGERTVSNEALVEMDRFLATLPVPELSEAIRRAHKEGNDSIQTAMDQTLMNGHGIALLEQEIKEDIAWKYKLLQSLRRMS